MESQQTLAFFDLRKISDYSVTEWPEYLERLKSKHWSFGIDHGVPSVFANELLEKVQEAKSTDEALHEFLNNPARVRELLAQDLAEKNNLERNSLRGFTNSWRIKIISLNNYLAFLNEEVLKLGRPALTALPGEESSEFIEWVHNLGVYDSVGLTIDDLPSMTAEQEFHDLCDEMDADFSLAMDNEREVWRDYVSVHSRATNVLMTFLLVEKFCLEAHEFLNRVMQLNVSFSPKSGAPVIDERLRSLKSQFGIEFTYTRQAAEVLFKLRQARNLYVHGNWEGFEETLGQLSSSQLLSVSSEIIFAVCQGIALRFQQR